VWRSHLDRVLDVVVDERLEGSRHLRHGNESDIPLMSFPANTEKRR
jgi:hypothetical protein